MAFASAMRIVLLAAGSVLGPVLVLWSSGRPAVAADGTVPAAELKFADADADASRAEYDRVVVPFFTAHCVACHNPTKAKGDLQLMALDPDLKRSTEAARWVTLSEKLASGEMPPKVK